MHKDQSLPNKSVARIGLKLGGRYARTLILCCWDSTGAKYELVDVRSAAQVL